MIAEFVDLFMAAKPQLESLFLQGHPKDYTDIVAAVITVLNNNKSHNAPDPKRIHLIDDGQYQGTLVYVIAESGYQPDTYWYVKVGYGSCSGCDTLEHILSQFYGKPTKDQVDQYMTLALHIVQGLKKMGDDAV